MRPRRRRFKGLSIRPVFLPCPGASRLARVAGPFPRPIQVAAARGVTLRFAFGDTLSRARPKGVKGYEIYVQIGGATPPTDISQCAYLATATRGTYTAQYPGSDGNKTAWYMARCVGNRGDRGPVSITVGATIAA